MTMPAGYGKARFGGRGGWKRFKLKEGDSNTYRIMPAMKSLAASGKWFQFIPLHYGYEGTSRNDPTKSEARPFLCIEEKNWQTKMITRECPECVLREEQMENLKQMDAQARVDGVTGEDLKTLLEPLNSWLKSHNVDKNYYMNVMNTAGEFGVLQIRSKAFKALDREIKTLAKNGIPDCTDFEKGVWFDFYREGQGLQTEYDCKIAMETLMENGRRIQIFKVAPLTEEQALLGLQECPDLTEVPRTISEDQIKMLIASDGDPAAVDAILAISQLRNRVEEQSREVSPKPTSINSAAPVKAAAPRVVVPEASPVAAEASPEVDEEAQLLAQLAAVKAKKAADAQKTGAVPTATTAKATATTTAKKPFELSHEEFLKKFPNPNTNG
jgi:hypothetical protein